MSSQRVMFGRISLLCGEGLGGLLGETPQWDRVGVPPRSWMSRPQALPGPLAAVHLGGRGVALAT